MGSGVKVEGTSDGEYYLYPVFQNNRVKYVCRVHYDGTEFVSTFGERFADEFNSILDQNYVGVNSLMISNNNLLLIQEDEITVWVSDRMNNKSYFKEEVTISSEISSTKTIKSLNEKLEYECIKDYVNTYSANTSYQLLIDIIETQVDKPWCAGYAAACIIRYMKEKTNIYAQTIADYGNIESDETIPYTLIQKYALNKHQIKVTRKTGGVLLLTTDIINEQLAAYNPIYGVYKSTEDSKGHAIVISGFDGTYVTFWNPWEFEKEIYKYNAYAFVASDGQKFVSNGYMTFED